MDRKGSVKENHLVVISNQLIDSCYSLNLVEKRVLWLLLSRIPANVERNVGLPEVTPETWININVEDYMRLTGISLANAYKEVREAAISLNDRVLYLDDPNTPHSKNRIRLHWVSECKFIPETHTVETRLSVSIIPYLTNLIEKFTQLQLDDAFSITSRHAWKLFDFFYKYKGTPCRSIVLTLQEIHNLLDIQEEDSYCLYKNLKNRILLPSIKELSDKFLCHITMEEQKAGRKVIGIKFKFLLDQKKIILANVSNK